MKLLPRGLRNNNPGNIKINNIKYEGETQPSTDDVFKQFKDMKYGYRAIFMLLYTYQKRYGLTTITEFINRYAPSTENHTLSYIRNVCKWSGLSRGQAINSKNQGEMIALVSAISRMENGVVAIPTQVAAGWELFIESVK